MESASGKAEDIAEIERLVHAWSRAVESKDPEKIVENYGPDTVLFDAIPPARAVGARAIGRIWADCMPHFPERFRSEHKDLTIHVDGDLAVLHALHHFAPEPASHPAGATWLRVTVALRRHANGWQVIHEHVSLPFNPMTNKAVFLDADAQSVAPPSSMGGVHLMPHLTCKGAADAIEFYKKAFDAHELMRLPLPDGRLLHAAISIGGNTVLLVDEFSDAGDSATTAPSMTTPQSVTLHLQLPDVDAAFQKAVTAGAKPITPLFDAFWGDRYGMLEDPFGHRWSMATTMKTLTADEIRSAAVDAMKA